VSVWYAGLDESQACIPDGHLHRVTYDRCHIDTIDSPDDEHMGSRNMYRIKINVHEKEFCVKLVIYKNKKWLETLVKQITSHMTMEPQKNFEVNT
jgi:hypothetical protein